MGRLWQFLGDALSSSPGAIFAIITAGPVLICIGWFILQILARL